MSSDVAAQHESARATRSRIERVSLACALSLALLVGSVPGHAKSELRWVPGETTLDQQLAAYLTDSKVVTDLVVMIDENFDLPVPIGITVGSGADARGVPSYTVQDRQIRLPYAYVEKAIRAQAELLEGVSPDESTESSAGEAVRRAMDMIEYTVYHLLGHALINDADVDADDRAEAISSWLMISAWPNGAEQWVADVQAFADASHKLDGSLDDYWHSHSLYRTREDTLTCWALGADPEAIEPMLPATLDPVERQERCVRSWENLDKQMRSLLDGVLKNDAPVRGNGAD